MKYIAIKTLICYLQKDGKVNVILSFTPTYAPRTTNKRVTKQSTNKQKPVEYKNSSWNKNNKKK